MFLRPRPSRSCNASLNSESAYDVERTVVTLEDSGFRLLDDDGVDGDGGVVMLEMDTSLLGNALSEEGA